MRWIVIAAMVCIGCAAPAAAQDAKAKGAQLFADQKCTLCHSIGDKGNKKGPLDDVGASCPRPKSASGSPIRRG